jgi:queuine tRNA-ribosyltransferase
MLTPESATDIQSRLGSDIAMVLDECLAHPATHDEVSASMQRTLRWADRARRRFVSIRSGVVADVATTNHGQAQFGIVQGGVYHDLRRASAEATAGYDSRHMRSAASALANRPR